MKSDQLPWTIRIPSELWYNRRIWEGVRIPVFRSSSAKAKVPKCRLLLPGFAQAAVPLSFPFRLFRLLRPLADAPGAISGRRSYVAKLHNPVIKAGCDVIDGADIMIEEP
ncbi:hypothetical protein, partial [Sphingomonas faeni]|uniref:hypothetical protein n=1 Tax=Sphingomonas faeni TaxID=185950 RepID=UPI0033520692